MKLTQILLAATFTAATVTTFAATAHNDQTAAEQKVVVSTQEQPEVLGSEQVAAQPTADPPGSEVAAEEDVAAQPAQ